MTAFNTNRTWGVEIEFKGSRGPVEEYMNAHGVSCRIEGYNHDDKNYWKIVTDSSAEFELVSPPLKGEEGFRQLKIACEALAAANARVDKTCGLHVHHDANDLSVREFANIFALYIKKEDVIDSMMPRSRRANNNQYCQSLTKYNNADFLFMKLKKATTIQDIQNIFPSRYYKLNVQSYTRHGTIEFRQHSGTIEFEKIYNWIILSQRFVERAIEGRVSYKYEEVADKIKMYSFQKMFGLIPSYGADEQLVKVNEFYTNRIKELRAA